MVLQGGDVTLPPWERYLNWVHDTAPPLSRDHGKENLPPPEETRKLPRKIRPHRRQEKHRIIIIIIIIIIFIIIIIIIISQTANPN